MILCKVINYLFFRLSPFRRIASTMSIEFFLSGLMKNGTTKLVMICEMRDAKAAPDGPQIGISSAFKATFATAADR